MAKTRKAARKSAAKRSAKKAGRTTTAKLKGRKVAKAKSRTAKKKGVIAGTMDAIAEAVRLRTRLGGHNRFEDQ